jgi:hypothetical protein
VEFSLLAVVGGPVVRPGAKAQLQLRNRVADPKDATAREEDIR